MADISKIKVNNTTYDIKDAVARESISGAIVLRGTTTTALTDGATTNPITIDGDSYTAKSNDAVFYGNKEFVFAGNAWREFGDMTGLGALASKDTATMANFTPAGTLTGGDVAFTSGTVNSITNVGTLPELTMNVASETLTITFSQGTLPTKGADQTVLTGKGTVTQPTFNGTATTITVS